MKLLVCSVDGCLTNGRIYVTEDHKEMVSYDYRDIIGINLLKKRGIQVRIVLKCKALFITVINQHNTLVQVWDKHCSQIP